MEPGTGELDLVLASISDSSLVVSTSSLESISSRRATCLNRRLGRFNRARCGPAARSGPVSCLAMRGLVQASGLAHTVQHAAKDEGRCLPIVGRLATDSPSFADEHAQTQEFFDEQFERRA